MPGSLSVKEGWQPLHKALEGQREERFTRVELMIVVLTIAILLAIALATFPRESRPGRTVPCRPMCERGSGWGQEAARGDASRYASRP